MRISLNILLLLIFLTTFPIQAFPIPENKKSIYDIIRKNKVIGSYEILFSENNGNLYLETSVEIEVKFLFVTAYKFSHQSKEVWRDGELVRIDGHTDFEDEREYFIKAEVRDGFLFATGMDGDLKLNNNLLPSNYWNQEVMYQNEIFDTQKGIVRKLDILEVGEEVITINNTKIDCTKFILNATRHPKDKELFPEYKLWYSKDKELMKFKFRSTIDKKIIEIIRKL